MSKMEIELTDEQMEKVKQLEAQNITVGQAIAGLQDDSLDDTILIQRRRVVESAE